MVQEQNGYYKQIIISRRGALFIPEILISLSLLSTSSV